MRLARLDPVGRKELWCCEGANDGAAWQAWYAAFHQQAETQPLPSSGGAPDRSLAIWQQELAW